MTAEKCPHCGQHPYEYIDVCRGAAKPEVVCCEKAQLEDMEAFKDRMRVVTEWFDGSTKPVHIGEYEIDYGSKFFGLPAWWDGQQWRYIFRGNSIEPTKKQNLRWRGLAVKP